MSFWKRKKQSSDQAPCAGDAGQASEGEANDQAFTSGSHGSQDPGPRGWTPACPRMRSVSWSAWVRARSTSGGRTTPTAAFRGCAARRRRSPSASSVRARRRRSSPCVGRIRSTGCAGSGTTCDVTKGSTSARRRSARWSTSRGWAILLRSRAAVRRGYGVSSVRVRTRCGRSTSSRFS